MLQFGCAAGKLLPAADDAVHVARVELDQPCPATGLLGGDQGTPRAAESIEDKIAGRGDVEQSLRDQRYRFDRRMEFKRLLPAGGESDHAGERPDIGAVAPVLPELDVVAVGRVALLEHHDKFVLAAVKSTHSALTLVPHADVETVVEHGGAGFQQLADVRMVHAHERDCAAGHRASHVPERHFQKAGKLA